jgi:hypothetical protein
MAYQIVYEPEKAPQAHSVYEWNDIKAPRVWRQSFGSEAEAHRWVKANSTFGK